MRRGQEQCVYMEGSSSSEPKAGGDVGKKVLVLTFILFVGLVIRRSSEDINFS